MSELRILTNEEEVRCWTGDRLFEELCALARASEERFDLPLDWLSPGVRGGRRCPFGSLRAGDRFYVRGEFWAPRERDEKWRGRVLAPVREVLEVRASVEGTVILTNEPGV
ncbi:MAG: hypothetical protein QOK40_696, partial [Miltoncostaeaceae bacterium]|nr:hypothetical protein [Miltoncostaeaceae bacterium]